MTLLTPDAYMALLCERRDQWAADHPHRPGAPPLIEWFVRDGDDQLVDMAAIEDANRATQPARTRQPRRHRPATYWRARIDRMQERLNTLTGVQRHPTTDPAVYGGVGIRQTPRQQRRYAARLDATAAEVVRLTSALDHARSMLTKAEAREAS